MGLFNGVYTANTDFDRDRMCEFWNWFRDNQDGDIKELLKGIDTHMQGLFNASLKEDISLSYHLRIGVGMMMFGKQDLFYDESCGNLDHSRKLLMGARHDKHQMSCLERLAGLMPEDIRKKWAVQIVRTTWDSMDKGRLTMSNKIEKTSSDEFQMHEFWNWFRKNQDGDILNIAKEMAIYLQRVCGLDGGNGGFRMSYRSGRCTLLFWSAAGRLIKQTRYMKMLAESVPDDIRKKWDIYYASYPEQNLYFRTGTTPVKV